MKGSTEVRVAIAGYGAVASIHARHLAAMSSVRLAAIYGPSEEKARAFAASHGIPVAATRLEVCLAGADAAIIASPSPVHASQAMESLRQGVHTLVELPPCSNAAEAGELGVEARRRGLTLQCAHTSRFLGPYGLLRDWICSDRLGEIEQITYLRHVVLNARSWRDDALLHHAAHAVDVLHFWLGDLLPVGCVTTPSTGDATSVSLLAAAGRERIPTAVSVSYSVPQPCCEMTVVTRRLSVVTDGFSFIRSTGGELLFTGEANLVYEAAIASQDAEFLRACKGEVAGTSWQETLWLMERLDDFRRLATRISEEQS